MSNEKLPSVKKNYILNTLLTVSSVLFPLITFPYVSRILGPEGMGKVSFATSFVAYFGIIAKLGIPTYGVRACAKVRDDKTELSRVAQELLIINLVMSAIAYGGLAVCLVSIPKVRDNRALILLISATLFLDSIGMEWLYGALEQYKYITIRSLIFKGIALVATFLLIRHTEDLIIYGGISIFATSASNILNLFNTHKYISLKPVGGYQFRRHWKAVVVFFAMACATTIYNNLDAVMLGFIRTDADVGYYNAAVKVKNVLVSTVTALGTVLLPRLSYYIEHGEMDGFRRMTRKALSFEILAAAPLMLFFILFSRESILLLSGAGFLGSVLPMKIIMPTVLFIGITNVLGIQMLVPLGREKTVLISVVAGAITDVVFNALLIPKYGAAGAAAGTLAAEAVVLAWQYRALRESIQELFRSFHWARLAAALLFASACCIWTKFAGLNLFLSVATAGLCFFFVYFGFLLWRKEEAVSEAAEAILVRLKKQ